ncbi:MAG: hypothetical protein KME23_04470 [Goleter apudmare HA4340-LM2]|nr:hypothetical protein [Goleter apudmare HA4340-LM2]
MNDIRLYSRVSTIRTSNSYKKKLAVLLEWNKIVYGCLESGQVEDAKIFLDQAIAEAEKPTKD